MVRVNHQAVSLKKRAVPPRRVVVFDDVSVEPFPLFYALDGFGLASDPVVISAINGEDFVDGQHLFLIQIHSQIAPFFLAIFGCPPKVEPQPFVDAVVLPVDRKLENVLQFCARE